MAKNNQQSLYSSQSEYLTLFEEEWGFYFANDEGEQRTDVDFDREDLGKLSFEITKAISPLKPFVGVFVFPAFDPYYVWRDSNTQFLKGYYELHKDIYPDCLGEVPLLFLGLHVASIFNSNRVSRGIFVTDEAIYTSIELYSDDPARRYPFPSINSIEPGWVGKFASQVIAEFDSKIIEQLVKLSSQTSDFDSEDNQANIAFVPTATNEQMSQILIAELTLALDALMAYRMHSPKPIAVASTGGERESREKSANQEQVPLSRRIMELGLTSYVKLGSDKKEEKHFKKLGKALSFEDYERIHFAFSDSTFAGAYGLAITDRAIRSRDLMEDPVSSSLHSSLVAMREEKDRSIIIENKDLHFVPTSIPERQFSAVITLLEEYLTGKIYIDC